MAHGAERPPRTPITASARRRLFSGPDRRPTFQPLISEGQHFSNSNFNFCMMSAEKPLTIRERRGNSQT
jgi:hypothetical protein